MIENQIFRNSEQKEVYMVIELRSRNQITLPKRIMEILKLSEHQQFDISIDDNQNILLKPVVVMEKEFLSINDLEESYMQYKAGNYKVSSSAAELIKDLKLKE